MAIPLEQANDGSLKLAPVKACHPPELLGNGQGTWL
jgi:hypothetical protein